MLLLYVIMLGDVYIENIVIYFFYIVKLLV